jgi:two-component system LytT family response regulator
MIKAIIVDDEPLARKRIRHLLREDHSVDISHECGDGESAISSINEIRPQLIFLDVQMPEIDGFEVLKRIPVEALPFTVFVTAHDRYAVDAFTANALDFLLKPINRHRFKQALEKAKSAIRSREESHDFKQKLLEFLNEHQPTAESLNKIVVKANGKHLFLKPTDIRWIQAEGDYVRIHLDKKSYLIREKMHVIQAKLDSKRFIRIHRSTMINFEFIKEAHPGIGGEYFLKLNDETELTVTKTYRHEIQKYLDDSL